MVHDPSMTPQIQIRGKTDLFSERRLPHKQGLKIAKEKVNFAVKRNISKVSRNLNQSTMTPQCLYKLDDPL